MVFFDPVDEEGADESGTEGSVIGTSAVGVLVLVGSIIGTTVSVGATVAGAVTGIEVSGLDAVSADTRDETERTVTVNALSARDATMRMEGGK